MILYLLGSLEFESFRTPDLALRVLENVEFIPRN